LGPKLPWRTGVARLAEWLAGEIGQQVQPAPAFDQPAARQAAAL